MKKKYIYFFIGTTAELIKLAPIMKRFKRRGIDYKIITSGQNNIDFGELEYLTGSQKVHIALHTKNLEPSTLKFMIWALKTLWISLFKLYDEFRNLNKENSYIVVHGDTISTLIGSIIAKIYGLKLVHIEAGLRSFNFFEPFPEELTRTFVSYLADVHFCPNDWALNNIRKRRGVKISTVQNTAYESFISAYKKRFDSKLLGEIGRQKFYFLMIHRQEHMLFKKSQTKKYVEAITSYASKKLKCIFVTHVMTANFLKSQDLYTKLMSNPNVLIISRLPFPEFTKVISRAEFIATDGGGNQVEAYYLGKPCIILRKTTENIEGIGENALLAKDNQKIIKKFLLNYKSKRRKKIVVKKLPSEIIVKYLLT